MTGPTWAYDTPVTVAVGFEEGSNGALFDTLTTPQGVTFVEQVIVSGNPIKATYTTAQAHSGALSIEHGTVGTPLLMLNLPQPVFPDLVSYWDWTQMQDPTTYPTYEDLLASLRSDYGLSPTASDTDIYAYLQANNQVPGKPYTITEYEFWFFFDTPVPSGGYPMANQNWGNLLRLLAFYDTSGHKKTPYLNLIDDDAGAHFHVEAQNYDQTAGAYADYWTGPTTGISDSPNNPSLPYGAWAKISQVLDGTDVVLKVNDIEIGRIPCGLNPHGDGYQYGLDGTNTLNDQHYNATTGAWFSLMKPYSGSTYNPTMYLDDLAYTYVTPVFTAPAPQVLAEGWGVAVGQGS